LGVKVLAAGAMTHREKCIDDARYFRAQARLVADDAQLRARWYDWARQSLKSARNAKNVRRRTHV
jgi:hypothetical protein